MSIRCVFWPDLFKPWCHWDVQITMIYSFRWTVRIKRRLSLNHYVWPFASYYTVTAGVLFRVMVFFFKWIICNLNKFCRKKFYVEASVWGTVYDPALAMLLSTAVVFCRTLGIGDEVTVPCVVNTVHYTDEWSGEICIHRKFILTLPLRFHDT